MKNKKVIGICAPTYGLFPSKRSTRVCAPTYGLFPSKRSQMNINEMLFMLLGLAFLMILLFLFFIAFATSNIKKVAESKAMDDTVLLASALAQSPELNCISGLGVESFVCIDSDKALALSNRPEYANFWDVNSIRIEKVYPIDNRTVVCNINNYPDCNSFIIVKNKTSVKDDYATFVSLCRRESIDNKFYNRCELGKILITPKIIR